MTRHANSSEMRRSGNSSPARRPGCLRMPEAGRSTHKLRLLRWWGRRSAAGNGMDFEKRLEKAIQRGRKKGDAKARAAAQAALSEEELRRLHSTLRLRITEQMERCVQSVAEHFPGFQVETLYGDKGWGFAASRDDLAAGAGRAQSLYSRLELLVRPFSDLHVLDVAAKGTVRNRELLTRSHFEKLPDAEYEQFEELIDRWVLEYAELYAAQ